MECNIFKGTGRVLRVFHLFGLFHLLEWNSWKSMNTAVFKKVATFNIDFASRDGNRTHQIAFRSCDSNFVRKAIEIERTKNFDSQIERTLLRSKKEIDCFLFDWHHQSHDLNAVSHDLNAIFERVT